jgi:hypothetical protein
MTKVIHSIQRKIGDGDGHIVVDGHKVITWTTEPPTVEGDYFVWAKDDAYFRIPTIVKVVDVEPNTITPVLTLWFGGHEYNLDRVTHWLGPLPVPEPPV